jgi:UPF0755 protein
MRRSLVPSITLVFMLCASCASRAVPEGGSDTMLFHLSQGSSAQQVAQELISAGLIHSKAFFLLRLRLMGADTRLEAGTYRFRKAARMGEILTILAQARVATSRVTIPEGATLSAIASAVDKAQVAERGDFLSAAGDAELLKKYRIPGASFEGYLFPDTYDISLGSGGKAVVELMARRFFERVGKLAPGAADDPQALNEKVILASIVEREYRVAGEAPLIASVFRNRIKIGMALQSCATIVYILTERQGKPHPSVVYLKDLSIADPYNTYRHRGLPPGPISNPGATALAAVFTPVKSEYLYFRIADEAKGTHRFSRTFDEHKDVSIPVKGL